MTVRPEHEPNALQTLRQQQTTPGWQAQYDTQAEIEGKLSQGVRAFGLRQHLAIAAAINMCKSLQTKRTQIANIALCSSD